jgi:hypothetical protein
VAERLERRDHLPLQAGGSTIFGHKSRMASLSER